MLDTISVIVPVYNSEKHIKRCVESITKQSYTSLQIILIDDGSKDKSGAICDKLAELDKRIMVFHQKNSGVSIARNRGIEVATGKYIMFVDSDDTLEHNMIEKMYNENKSANLVLCGYKNIYKDKCLLSLPQSGTYTFKEYTKLLKYWQFSPVIGSPCNKLFSTEIIKKNHIRFEVNESYAEDYCFNINYLFYIEQVSAIEEPLYNYYRDTTCSLSKNNMKSQEKIWNRQKYILRLLKKLMVAHGLDPNFNNVISEILCYSVTTGYISRLKVESKIDLFDWLNEIKDNTEYFGYVRHTKKILRFKRASLTYKLIRNIIMSKSKNVSYLVSRILFII